MFFKGFISLMRFLPYSLVSCTFSRSFEILFFFFFFSFIGVCLIVYGSNVTLIFFFSGRPYLPLFSSSIPSLICRFPLLNFSMVQLFMPNSIAISWLYILTAFIRVSNSFSFCQSLVSSMYVITYWRVFYISESRWFFPGFWVTEISSVFSLYSRKSGRDYVIRLYLKIPEELVRHIF